MVDRIAIDWETSGLDGPTLALVRFAEKLTRTPAAVTEDDVHALRDSGFEEAGISSCVQVVSYFNYINRIAEGLGIEHEDWIDAAGRIKDQPDH
ncbi:MAG: carboxymuconolactone decarboxylase family protein [Acidimicrobiia bacterium]